MALNLTRISDAEYVLIRSEAGARIPEGVDAAKYAPFLCAGLTCFNSMRRMNVGPGETVAIQGLGGLGHLGIQYANKFGYRVVAISRGSEKEQFARDLGAHEYIDTSAVDAAEALKALGGAALVVSTNPSGEQIPQLLQGLQPLGKLLLLSRKTLRPKRDPTEANRLHSSWPASSRYRTHGESSHCLCSLRHIPRYGTDVSALVPRSHRACQCTGGQQGTQQTWRTPSGSPSCRTSTA